MRCQFCGAQDTKVIDSRLVSEGNQIRRRRVCPVCEERFTTYEIAELVMPRVVKTDGRRVPFDEEKLRVGIAKALEKRPISTEACENTIARIILKIRSMGEREISSALIGEYVMQALRSLDEVAYVRFASVYRQFEDVEAFRKEIKRLKNKKETSH